MQNMDLATNIKRGVHILYPIFPPKLHEGISCNLHRILVSSYICTSLNDILIILISAFPESLHGLFHLTTYVIGRVLGAERRDRGAGGILGELCSQYF